MASPEIKIEGLNKAIRTLKQISPELAAEVKDVNRDLAERLVPVAKVKVPVRSGALRNSIRAGATQRSGVVRAGKKALPYTKVIHFGWPRRNIGPQPFLYEALDSRRHEVEREYIARVTKIVEAASNG